MSWDFEFETDSFDTSFDDADAAFLSGNDSLLTSSFEIPSVQQEPFFTDTAVRPIQDIPQNEIQEQNKGNKLTQNSLAEENDQLRQFFTSLKEKAAQAESLNQSLKSQLEDCRNWFKDAMFSGISNQK